MPRHKGHRVRRPPSAKASLWDRKMDAKVYERYLTVTKPLAKRDVEAYQVVHTELTDLVRKVLEKYGAEYVRIYGYVSFAEKIWKAKLQYSGDALQLEVDAHFLFWLVRGYYEDILREIAKKLGVNISDWNILLGRIGLGEEVIYRATKRALRETLPGIDIDPKDTEIEYDDQGNPVKIRLYDKILGKTKIIELEYDAEGNIKNIREEWE